MTLMKSIRMVSQMLSPSARKWIYTTVGNFSVGKTMLYHYQVHSLNAYILSFPKCGRTWLRLMLARAIQLHFGLKGFDPLASNYLVPPIPGGPSVKITHDDKPQLKTPDELNTDKTMYKDTKVILLVRDPRDAIVSNYYQQLQRRNRYNGDLPSFLGYKRGSTDTFIRFYNIWAENRHIPAEFLLVRYEDIHSDTEKQLRRTLRFLGIDEISDTIVREAIEFARFDNMRQMELKNSSNKKGKLRARDKNNPESFKTRRGSVGGFVDYLCQADIERLNHKVNNQLSSFYGYKSEARVSNYKREE